MHNENKYFGLRKYQLTLFINGIFGAIIFVVGFFSLLNTPVQSKEKTFVVVLFGLAMVVCIPLIPLGWSYPELGTDRIKIKYILYKFKNVDVKYEEIESISIRTYFEHYSITFTLCGGKKIRVYTMYFMLFSKMKDFIEELRGHGVQVVVKTNIIDLEK